MDKIKKLLGFFIILAVAWIVTEPKKPKEEPPPEITRRKLPKETPYKFPADYIWIHSKLENVFGGISSSFTEGNVPVLILSNFTMAMGSSPELLTHVTESAYTYLSDSRNLRIVKRDYNKKSRIKAKYILIGRLIPTADQIRISVRIENINTGEITEIFDEYIDRNKAGIYLTASSE
jgi:hypothetical protein